MSTTSAVSLDVASGLIAERKPTIKYWAQHGFVEARKISGGKRGHPGWKLTRRGLLRARLIHKVKQYLEDVPPRIQPMLQSIDLEYGRPQAVMVRDCFGGKLYVVIGSAADARKLLRISEDFEETGGKYDSGAFVFDPVSEAAALDADLEAYLVNR